MNNGGWGTARFKRVNKCGHLEKRHYAKGMCRQCYRNTPEFKALRREYYQNNPGQWERHNQAAKARCAHETRLYGISREEAVALRKATRCDLCGGAPGKRRLSIDHCHATGAVRGVLCTPCNTALGGFRDDPALCERAAAYLRCHSLRAKAAAVGNSRSDEDGSVRRAGVPQALRKDCFGGESPDSAGVDVQEAAASYGLHRTDLHAGQGNQF